MQVECWRLILVEGGAKPFFHDKKIGTEAGTKIQAAEGETVPTMIAVRRVDIRRVEVEVGRTGISR